MAQFAAVHLHFLTLPETTKEPRWVHLWAQLLGRLPEVLLVIPYFWFTTRFFEISEGLFFGWTTQRNQTIIFDCRAEDWLILFAKNWLEHHIIILDVVIIFGVEGVYSIVIVVFVKNYVRRLGIGTLTIQFILVICLLHRCTQGIRYYHERFGFSLLKSGSRFKFCRNWRFWVSLALLWWCLLTLKWLLWFFAYNRYLSSLGLKGLLLFLLLLIY